jgi:glycine/D-amino acid oxidase-like deaminating enzyme
LQLTIIGAGAIGGTIGAHLIRDGHDILLCDAAPHGADMSLLAAASLIEEALAFDRRVPRLPAPGPGDGILMQPRAARP